MTNCCDDYGNCRQGRDCPVRTGKAERIERVVKIAKNEQEKKGVRDDVLDVLMTLILLGLILLAIFVGSLYQKNLVVVA